MTALHLRAALLPDGWAANVRLTLDGPAIASLARDVEPQAGDDCHAIGVPGMASLHSHAFQRGMAGLAEIRGPVDDTFWTWREVMYRFALGMDPEDVEAVAEWLYVEMLEAGFTHVGEFHYLHHDRDGHPYADPAELATRIVAAAAGSGIGLTLLPVFYAHANFAGAPPHAGQRRFITTPDRFAALVDASRTALKALPGANLGIAPHSLRAVTPDELHAVRPLAQGGPIHIHAAEQRREVEDCLAWSGQRPVEWLLAHAGADADWTFIHATHMTPDETRAMAAAGITAGLCPLTEASLGDGIFNAPDFLQAGGSFGIGTDSNILIGVADELRQLEYAQRLDLTRRNVIARAEGASTGRALFEQAHAGGQKALKIAPTGLATGARADIVTLDPDHPALIARSGNAWLDGWIFASRTSPVDCVYAGGVKRVAGGQHVGRARAFGRFRAAIRRLIGEV